MSIDYSFGVAFGFILSADEYGKYVNYETEEEEELYDKLEDMTMCTYNYDSDSEYIYAFSKCRYGCVGAEKYEEDDLRKEVTPEELEEFYNFFPHRRGEKPSVIVFNQIW